MTRATRFSASAGLAGMQNNSPKIIRSADRTEGPHCRNLQYIPSRAVTGNLVRLGIPGLKAPSFPGAGFYWPANALPLRIEQLGDDVVPEETSYITPFGPLRRIVPPLEWPSITLAVQLEKPESNVAVI